MEYYLAPSILSADFKHLGDDILAVKECGAKILHFDVMDGLVCPEHFLRNAGACLDPAADGHVL